TASVSDSNGDSYSAVVSTSTSGTVGINNIYSGEWSSIWSSRVSTSGDLTIYVSWPSGTCSDCGGDAEVFEVSGIVQNTQNTGFASCNSSCTTSAALSSAMAWSSTTFTISAVVPFEFGFLESAIRTTTSGYTLWSHFNDTEYSLSDTSYSSTFPVGINYDSLDVHIWAYTVAAFALPVTQPIAETPIFPANHLVGYWPFN